MKYLIFRGLISSFVQDTPALAPTVPVTPVVKKKDKAAKLIDRAADLIQERGWVQGRMEDAMGRICALKAIALASNSDSFMGRLFPAAKNEAIRRVCKETKWISVPAWNDFIYTSHIEVVNTLRKVASS